jgi:nucleoside-diphosphate-sugar epimerase
MTTPHPTILLTGASGVVGQALLREFTDVDLICLTHRTPVTGPNVMTVAASLTKPGLGIDPLTYQGIVASVDAIVHCAAVTGFSAGREATNDLNVAGTAQLVELAERAGVPLYYVSTAFVARNELTRDKHDTSTETEGAARPESYLDSKRAAEAIVRSAHVPTTIIRPSVVIGDSRTGKIAQFQGLHTLVGAIMRNAVPLFPLEPAALIDFVPQDLVAQAIAGLVRSGGTGQEHWVTAGANAMTLERVIELAVQIGQDLGLPTEAPRLVSFDMVDRLIRPVFIDPLPAAHRRRFDDMLAMAALFSTERPFESTVDQIRGLTAPDQIDIEWAFVASVRHYALVKNLQRLIARAAA